MAEFIVAVVLLLLGGAGAVVLRSRFPLSQLAGQAGAVAGCAIGLIGAIFALPALLRPGDSMEPAMLCSLLIGPVGALVVGWGLVRLWRGDGRRFPALRWLVWLPALVGVAGFVLG